MSIEYTVVAEDQNNCCSYCASAEEDNSAWHHARSFCIESQLCGVNNSFRLIFRAFYLRSVVALNSLTIRR